MFPPMNRMGPGQVPGPRQYGQGMIGGPGVVANPEGQALAAALTGFVDSYRESKYQKKIQAQQNVEQALRFKQMGIPVDNEKLAQDMKKSGLPLDLEGPSSTEMNQAAQAAQNSPLSQMLALNTGMDINSPMFGQMSMAPGQSNVQPQRPQGMPTPAMSQAQLSPVVQSLNQMDNMVGQQRQMQQMGQQVQMGELQQKANMQQILNAAMSGNPQATELAVRTGMYKAFPHDEIVFTGMKSGLTPLESSQKALWMMLDGPAMMKTRLGMVEKISERFGGDMQKAMAYWDAVEKGQTPQFKPQMTIEEASKMSQEYVRMKKLYPDAPGNIIDEMLHMQVLGDREGATKIMGYITKNYKSAEQIKNQQWQVGQNMEEAKFRLSAQGQAFSQGMQQANLSFDKQKFAMGHQLAVFSKLNEVANEEFNRWYRLANLKQADGKVDEDQLAEATKGLASALKKIGDITYTDPLSGKEVRVSPNRITTALKKDEWGPDFLTGEDSSYVKFEDPSAVTDKFVGSPNFTSPMFQWFQANANKPLQEGQPQQSRMASPFGGMVPQWDPKQLIQQMLMMGAPPVMPRMR